MSKFNPRDDLLLMRNNGADNQNNHISNLEQIRSAAFDASPVAQVVVDVNGLLILANERCCAQFNLSSRDIGRPLQEVEFYRPLELRVCIERVCLERRNALQNQVEWTNPKGESLYFDIKIAPLFDLDGRLLLGVSITFIDATRERKLQEKLKHSNQ